MTTEALWPSRRADGSVSVAVRYAVDSAPTVRALEEFVSTWVTERLKERGWESFPDLARDPHVVERNANTTDVVFDGSSGSRLWKDWMVFLARDSVAEPIEGLRVECFVDLVSGRARRVTRQA